MTNLKLSDKFGIKSQISNDIYQMYKLVEFWWKDIYFTKSNGFQTNQLTKSLA